MSAPRPDINNHKPGAGNNLSQGARMASRLSKDSSPLALFLIVGTAVGSAAWFFSSKTKQHNQFDGTLGEANTIHTAVSPKSGKPKAGSQQEAHQEMQSPTKGQLR